MILQIFALRAFGAFATFGLGVYLARILGVEGYGFYSAILGSVTFIATVGQLGSGMAIIKLRLGKPSGQSNALLTGYYIWHIIVSILGIGIASGFYFLFSDITDSITWYVFLIFLLASFTIQLTRNIYQSIKQSSLSMITDMVLMPVIMLFIIFMFDVTTPSKVIITYIAVGMTSAVGMVIFFLRYFKGFRLSTNIEIKWDKWMPFSFGFLFSQFGHALIFIQLPVVLHFVVSDYDMGLFTIAYKLAAIQLIAFTAIGTYVTPQFADYNIIENTKKLSKLLKKMLIISLCLSLPIFLLLFFFPEIIIETLFGEKYLSAVELLPLLAFGLFFHSASGPLGNFLIMNGDSYYYSIVSIIAGGSGIAITIIMGYYFSSIGATLAICITIITWKSMIIFRSFNLFNKLKYNQLV